MCRGTILLKYFTILYLILVILLQFSQTCSARKSKNYCPPSACGHIRNISYPFRLKTDPQYCGFPEYELACEGNQTVISLFSKKLYVQAINYDNQTLRLVDPTLQTQNKCSLRPWLTFRQYNGIFSNYYTNNGSIPIFKFNCPFAINNSTFLEITGCKLSRYTYLRIGEMNASEVSDGCRVEFITLTSWPNIKDDNNISLSDFRQAINYGFELYYGNPRFILGGGVIARILALIFWYMEIPVRYFLNKLWFGGPILRYMEIADRYFIHKLSFGGPILRVIAGILWCIEILLVDFIMYSGAKFVISLPFIIAFLVFKFKRRHLSMYEEIEGFLQTQNNFMPIRYNYSNIKRMTRGFKEKLGEGGYGSVYKGKLRSGRDVAVKMLSNPKAGGQDFMNEVATIGRIHHVSVVGLVGYCVERTKRALVYDFMPNGSLDKYISQEGSPLLSWQRQYDIVLGVARGIEYLHRGCDVRILHFDIKPHNILLDENFIPKISDFGLAKLYPTDNSIVTLTAARGTIGYVAPELISRSIGAISYKADVYSFGMLLMEMLDLKRNVVANEDNSSQYFPSWVYDKLNKGKEIVVDEEANDDEKKMARKMTLVALWCIQTNPVQRPSMSKVVEMLEGEVEVLEVPPQPLQSQPIALFHQMESSMTFSFDSTALLENSVDNPVELDICLD
ncbi:rust resistance kinase Lr10-like isoform X2 [Lycium barbarum]|uniref:rust resistance kinase Lr10-like isoform X2 n=1 Tax=Lycium barbarum TaxID=112863 RepID=UPI00293E7702|nr:rust resistance kinase Lr10-like isoform X2 [Lycium barbarum]